MRRVAGLLGLTLIASVGLMLPGAAQDDRDSNDASGGAKAAPARPDPKTTGVVQGTITFPAVRKRRRRARVRYPGQAPGSRKSKKSVALPAVVYLLDVKGTAPKGTAATMSQEGIAFDPRVLAVQVGTKVAFPNLDPVYHNVLSYSTTKRFDLGRYAKGEVRDVTFDKAGVVRLACEIHQHMRGFVVVLEQPHFTTSDTRGRFKLAGLPPGTHKLAVWHDRFTVAPIAVEVAAGKSLSVKLTATAK